MHDIRINYRPPKSRAAPARWHGEAAGRNQSVVPASRLCLHRQVWHGQGSPVRRLRLDRTGFKGDPCPCSAAVGCTDHPRTSYGCRFAGRLFLLNAVSRVNIVSSYPLVRATLRLRAAMVFAMAVVTTLTPVAWSDAPTSRPADAAILEQLQRAYVSIADRLAPSVVTVLAERIVSSDGGDRTAATAIGSGVIVRDDGMVLTSQHVVAGARDIFITLHDGRRIRAVPVAADPRSDLAVLRIEATGLAPAKLSDAGAVRRGHIVLALGNPLGLAHDGQAAVSEGIVSAIGRPLPETFGLEEDRYYGDMIQTTARIAPGNSGGPLIDIHGRVIGIVTAVGTPPGAAQTVGFAVPINAHTRTIIDKLLEGRSIEYGYLGILAGNPTHAQWQAAGISGRAGAVLDSVLPGGTADHVGLKPGDIIVAVDKTVVLSADHLIRLIGAAGPGSRIKIGFLRKAERRHVAVELARRRPLRGQGLPTKTAAFRGATLGEVDAATRDAANLPGPALLVLRVNEGSPADIAGLTPGDVIIRVQGENLSANPTIHIKELSGNVLLGLANGGSILVKPQ